ncbi:hypothetical protein RFI_15532, partial [Reticulomyxa filosa]
FKKNNFCSKLKMIMKIFFFFFNYTSFNKLKQKIKLIKEKHVNKSFQQWYSKNIVKPYKQLFKMTYTSTITKANKLVLRLNRNSNVDISAAVSGKYIICHVSDSEFKTKEVKGICPGEDIADIQSELENESHAIRTVIVRRNRKKHSYALQVYRSSQASEATAKLRIGFIYATIITNNIKNIEIKEQQSQNIVDNKR